VDFAGQDVRGDRPGIRDEPNVDAIDLRPAEDVLVVGVEHDAAAEVELAQLVRASPDKVVVPVAEVQEVVLVLEVGLLEAGAGGAVATARWFGNVVSASMKGWLQRIMIACGSGASTASMEP